MGVCTFCGGSGTTLEELGQRTFSGSRGSSSCGRNNTTVDPIEDRFQSLQVALVPKTALIMFDAPRLAGHGGAKHLPGGPFYGARYRGVAAWLA